MYILLLLAVLAANAPFLSNRFFFVMKFGQQKSFWLQLIEFVFWYAMIGLIAYVLESKVGVVKPQDWEFYATTVALFCVFAFPGFVWRYFWKSRHLQ
jgi:hypothetical protein